MCYLVLSNNKRTCKTCRHGLINICVIDNVGSLTHTHAEDTQKDDGIREQGVKGTYYIPNAKLFKGHIV